MIYQLGDKVRIQQKYLDLEFCHSEWRAAGEGIILRYPDMMDSLAFTLLYGLVPAFMVQFEGIGHPVPVHEVMIELAGEREGYPLRFAAGDLVQLTQEFCQCERCDFTMGTVVDVVVAVGGASTDGDYTVQWDDATSTCQHYDSELTPAGQRLEEL